MKYKGIVLIAVLVLTSLSLGIGYATLNSTSANVATRQRTQTDIIQADDPSPPSEPVKLIFIHHSTGGNWLADPNEEQYYGGLGDALMENNYFVSATNYGWGPDQIGSNTDIGYWWDWFRGENSSTYLTALYNENGQNICNPTTDPPYECFGEWPRLGTEPPGENEIVMFKGCFPNAHLGGDPTNDPTTGDNPLRGQSAWVTEIPNPNHTVENAKGIYNDILQYFATRQDKLFIVITGPPLTSDDTYFPTDAAHAANYRAFNEWLVNDWLPSNNYTHTNVAVFDYYNVLTSNNGDPETNDEGLESGNHHRWWNNAIQYISPTDYDLSAYAMWQDSHPTTAGQQKATAEFIELLNIFYNRWKDEEPSTCTPITAAGISGPSSGYTNTQYAFNAVITPSNATSPAYTWTPEPDSGQGSQTARYTWAMTGTHRITLTVENCEGSGTDTATHDITLMRRSTETRFIYLPLVLHAYAPSDPTCDVPLTGVSIDGPTTGYTNTTYAFSASPVPANATSPVAYTWSPTPESGQGTANAAYMWDTADTHTLYVTASNCGGGSNTAQAHHTITIQGTSTGGDLVQPSDLTYLGAFRLPDDGERPLTFEYGGNAMTFNPDGDPDNADAHAGSLFITGHDRLPYDELPNGDQVAEVSIPVPTVGISPTDLPQATFIQAFHDVTAGYFTNMEEIPKVGMQYLNHADTGPLIHLSWGQHLQPPNEPSHAWFSPNLATPNLQGVWFIGNQNLYSTNGYMFDIPASWADTHAQGRYLATGRMRDGGQGGMGPALFAYRPWEAGGTAPVSGTHLVETPLLLYENSYTTQEITRCVNNYQHPDEWEGGAWLTTPSGKSAVMFAGTKSNGSKYWYGYINPDGPDIPCVDAEVSDFPTCHLANGDTCPPSDLTGCCDENEDTCVTQRGWWTTHFDAQFMFYDPADLARVAAGQIASWEAQPYATLDVDEHLYLDPPVWDLSNLGWGNQRRYRIGPAAYDRTNGFLYVLELFADGAKPVVHVWQVP